MSLDQDVKIVKIQTGSCCKLRERVVRMYLKLFNRYLAAWYQIIGIKLLCDYNCFLQALRTYERGYLNKYVCQNNNN